MDCVEQKYIYEEKLEKISELMEQMILDAMLKALCAIRENRGVERLIAKEFITGDAQF